MRILHALLVLFVPLALSTRTAAASDDVGVIVTGDAALRAPLSAHLEAWLRARGHAPIEAALPAEAIGALHACLARSDEPCARQIFDKRASATTLVLANVEVTAAGDGTRNITLTGYWLRQGRDAIADRRFCERCTEHTLRHAADELMTELARAGQHATGRLSLTSSPSGVTVLASGAPIGATPLEYDLVPGTHLISLSAPHHEIETRQVVIRDGETTRLAIPLVPSERARGRTGSRAVPAGLMGLGAAVVVTGAILLVIDEDPSPTGPLEIRNTAPLGAALVATGGAVVIAGAILWVRRGRDAGPVASVARDGGYLGWSGRF